MSATVQPDLPEEEPVLPEAVRVRVMALAAAALTGLAADEVPTALRKVANFAPNRRAKLGGSMIAAQLASFPTMKPQPARKPQKCPSRSRP